VVTLTISPVRLDKKNQALTFKLTYTGLSAPVTQATQGILSAAVNRDLRIKLYSGNTLRK